VTVENLVNQPLWCNVVGRTFGWNGHFHATFAVPPTGDAIVDQRYQTSRHYNVGKVCREGLLIGNEEGTRRDPPAFVLLFDCL